MSLRPSRFGVAALMLLSAVPAASAAEPPPASQEIIYMGEATSILGRAVIGPNNDQVGRIADVLVDDQGQPRAAVIDIGGFLGIGQRRIAVAWRALHFLTSAKHPQIRIDLTIDQIKATPEWKVMSKPEGPPVTMAAPPPASAAAPVRDGTATPPGTPAPGK